jgi:hypothetical protein
MTKHVKEQITVTEAEATTETVAQCERVLAELGQRRDRLHERLGELERERGQVAYAAHTGDGAAGKLLDKTIAETVKHSEHVKALGDAIAEAGRRLEQARAREQREADRQRARDVRQVLGELVEGLGLCGKALDLFVVGANKANTALDSLHRLGCAYPSRDQVRVYGALAIHTRLMQSALWAREVGRHLAPNERKSFDELKVQWHDMVERNAVAPYLDDGEQINGEQQIKTETEAA